MEGKFFVNPGSATGAVSWNDAGRGQGDDVDEEVDEEGNVRTTPSFVLMDVQGDVLVLYVYQIRKDVDGVESVGVEKVSFRKGGSS